MSVQEAQPNKAIEAGTGNVEMSDVTDSDTKKRLVVSKMPVSICIDAIGVKCTDGVVVASEFSAANGMKACGIRSWSCAAGSHELVKGHAPVDSSMSRPVLCLVM